MKYGRGVFVLWTRELMNQFLKNHQLNKAEIGVTDESISDWISGLQDTFSSIEFDKLIMMRNSMDYHWLHFHTTYLHNWIMCAQEIVFKRQDQ